MTARLVSDEVRWFRPGGVPDGVLAWFDNLAGPSASERRVDRYLELPQTVGLGVKLRQGQLEVKRLRAEYPAAAWHGLAGRPARWEKWSFALVEDGAAERIWLPVEKRRRFRTLRVGDDGAVTPGAPGARVDRGCSVEVTRLAVQDARWWSVGFEATGDEAGLRRTLDLAIEHAAGAGRPLGLSVADSVDYPAWLSALLASPPTGGDS